MLVFIYVWVDSNNDIKTKTRILENLHDDNDDLYNGIISNEHNETDVVLKAKKVIKNPFMNESYILLCDTWIYTDDTLSQHFSNKRQFCDDYIKMHKDDNTTFELFQTFYILNKSDNKPITNVFNNNICNNCYVVSESEIMNELIKKCFYSDLNITSFYSENGHDQWTVSIKGDNIDAADQLVLLRYILIRVCDKYGAYPSFKPVPHDGYNPSGLCVSFESESMRESYEAIQYCIRYLSKNHKYDLEYYGNNQKRLSSFQKHTFSFGISKGGVSVNIPKETFLNKKGKIIDNRPASDANPYYVILSLYKSVNPEKN